jgi:hypothetical protein
MQRADDITLTAAADRSSAVVCLEVCVCVCVCGGGGGGGNKVGWLIASRSRRDIRIWVVIGGVGIVHPSITSQ